MPIPSEIPAIQPLAASIGPIFNAVIALALAMARPLAVLTLVPAFTRFGLTGILRNGVAAAIALPALPAASAVVLESAHGLTVVAIMAKEVFVGILLGIFFGIPFWGAAAAGSYLDFQRGSQAAFIIDPLTQTQDSILGTLFVFVLIVLFYIGGGMLLLADGLYGSYGIWPIDQLAPGLDARTPDLMLRFLDRIMHLALLLAGPIIIMMLLADLILAAVTRFAPQLNAFDLSLSVKSIVVVLALPLYALLLVGYLGDSLTPIGQALGFLDMVRP